ncbi:MAG: rhodanese-like domain-containing protein [Pseudomonadota bacterium]|nr:rhodanese-like domain-containing protein [Pseudomonadota bacterium]
MAQYLEFAGNHPFLVTALVLIVLLMIMNESRRKLLGFKELGTNEAVRLMNSEEALMLDVREEGEFKDGHVMNAVHIPLGVLESRLKEIETHKEKPVIVYCRTGQRAAKAGAVLQRQGFKSIYKLNGGMMAWSDAGLPVKR